MIEDATQDSNSPGKSFWQRRWARLAFIWGIWTFIGLVFTLQGYFTSFRSEKPVSFLDSLYLQMTWSYLWALATPLVLWAASRLPIERNNWVRSSLLHIPISIVLSGILTALGHVMVWLYWGWSLGRPFSFERMARFVVANFSEGIGIYLLIALTSYAFSYYRRYREGQLRTLRRALIRTGGHQRRAARLLNLKVTTLNSKIKHYNIHMVGGDYNYPLVKTNEMETRRRA